VRGWFIFFLVMHVLGVILAFGPDIVMIPLIATMGQKYPRYSAFAAEVIHVFETKVATPVAVLIPLFGVGLIYTADIDLWKSEWLIVSIILYIGAFFFAVTIQTSNSAKFVKLLQSMPAPPLDPGVPPAAEPGGPPPEVAALGRKLQLGGMYLALSVIVILVLMIWRPGAAFT
jgi:Predicted integral membrane protein (DUF2269)